MAYIETHQSLRDHRKILALAAELDMPEPHVAGHCVYLWLWSLDNAQEGVLPVSRRIIEKAAGWIGKPGAFVDAMIDCGMLDVDDEGVLHVHDWMDYAGRLIEKRKSDAERKRRERSSTPRPPDIPRTSHGHPEDRARAGAPSVPYPTEANRTVEHPSSSGESVIHVAAEAERASKSERPLYAVPGGGDVESLTLFAERVAGVAHLRRYNSPAFCAV